MEIYITIVVLGILFAVVIHHDKVKQMKILQRKGVVNITHIKALVSLVQIHRGLSSAWLNGDQAKQSALLALQTKMKREVSYLEEQVPITQHARWFSFSDHWVRLIRLDIERSPDNNFKQHTQLIGNLLYLLEDEAERSHLNATSLPEFKSIGFVWRELVTTTESIGQSRAIGTGVATVKYCSSVDKIRLSFLQQNIQKTTNETLARLSSLKASTAEHRQLLKAATTKMESLSDTIERELISAAKVTINQDEYFSLATDSINALDKIFEHQIDQIKRLL